MASVAPSMADDMSPPGDSIAPVGGTAGAVREPSGDGGPGRLCAMSDTVKLVPPLEKVRLRKLTTTDSTVHVGVEIEYRIGAEEPTRLQFGLVPADAVRLGEQLAQLGEKLNSTEH